MLGVNVLYVLVEELPPPLLGPRLGVTQNVDDLLHKHDERHEPHPLPPATIRQPFGKHPDGLLAHPRLAGPWSRPHQQRLHGVLSAAAARRGREEDVR